MHNPIQYPVFGILSIGRALPPSDCRQIAVSGNWFPLKSRVAATRGYNFDGLHLQS
jgi:hypothetical protein